MTSHLTRVTLASRPGRLNVYLRFGQPVKVTTRDSHRRDAYFAPNQVFCRVWWQGNRYGSVHWQLDVLQAKPPGELLQAVYGIAPGVERLLSVKGARSVKAAIRSIETIEGQGLAPTDTSVTYWRVLHNRLTGGALLTLYGQDRHVAEILRRRLA